MKPFLPRKLPLLISLSVAGVLPAFAQQPAAMDEVIITASPIRDSQKAAIEAKRAADNTVDIISADTIGRFPDQNLADSLGRIPGLAIERDQGQARYINFRGAPFRYTALAIDGISIPGAENGRVPRFDSFPSVITRSIAANKAIMPNMPGEAVSGYIDISTFDAFATRGWTLSSDVGLGNQQLGDGDVEKLAFRTSWSGDSLGFSLFGSKNSREQITDNREYDLEMVDGQLQVNELDFRSYKLTREDTAYGGRLEFRPEGAVQRVFISSLYNEFTDHEERNQYVFNFAGGAAALGMEPVVGRSGSLPLVLVTRMLEDGIYENSTFSNTLGADFLVGDWLLETRLNFTDTENTTFLPIPYSAGGQVAASFDLSDLEDPIVRISAPFSDAPMNVNDIEYAVNYGLVYAAELSIDAKKLKADAERDIALLNHDAVLKLGVEFDQREADGFGTNAAMGLFPASVNIADFASGDGWDTDFTNSIGGTYYNNAGLRRAWAGAAGGLTVQPSSAMLIRLEEEILAAYGMVTTDFSWGNLVLGTRVETTDYRSQGPEADYSEDFAHVLPSAHVNIDLADDLKLRVSATTALSRPTYNEWRAAAAVNVTDRSVTGGNPSLKAEEAWGSDIALEWYLGDASLLSAGAFMRRVDHVIYADSTTVDGSIYLPTAAGESWSYTGHVNGKDGKLSGAELNFIAQAADMFPALQGFGLSANVTFLDSEFKTLSGNTFSLPGTSDLIYNASLFYETERFSIRLNQQYRDAWLSTTENDSMAEYWADQKRVDLAVSYDLPASLFAADMSLYANVNNLTEEEDMRYVGSARTPNQFEGYGRHYVAGMRVSF